MSTLWPIYPFCFNPHLFYFQFGVTANKSAVGFLCMFFGVHKHPFFGESIHWGVNLWVMRTHVLSTSLDSGDKLSKVVRSIYIPKATCESPGRSAPSPACNTGRLVNLIYSGGGGTEHEKCIVYHTVWWRKIINAIHSEPPRKYENIYVIKKAEAEKRGTLPETRLPGALVHWCRPSPLGPCGIKSEPLSMGTEIPVVTCVKPRCLVVQASTELPSKRW